MSWWHCQRYPLFTTECYLNALGATASFMTGSWLIYSWNRLDLSAVSRRLSAEQVEIYSAAMDSLNKGLLAIGIACFVIGILLLLNSTEACCLFADSIPYGPVYRRNIIT